MRNWPILQILKTLTSQISIKFYLILYVFTTIMLKKWVTDIKMSQERSLGAGPLSNYLYEPNSTTSNYFDCIRDQDDTSKLRDDATIHTCRPYAPTNHFWNPEYCEGVLISGKPGYPGYPPQTAKATLSDPATTHNLSSSSLTTKTITFINTEKRDSA
jgi:hypothetical protein